MLACTKFTIGLFEYVKIFKKLNKKKTRIKGKKLFFYLLARKFTHKYFAYSQLA